MKPLIGINPDDTAEVEFGGAVFTIGPMEALAWERLNHRFLTLYRHAYRRAIKELAVPEGAALSAVDEDKLGEALAKDMTFREEQARIVLEMASYSVRGHKGFVNRDGSEVPFKVEGSRVAAETLRRYLYVPGLVDTLHRHIRAMHTLSEVAKKA